MDGMAAMRAGGLSSARDRARLREREAAERARVERVLARGPREVERRRGERSGDRPSAPSGPGQGSERKTTRGAAASLACAVCGGREILEDEVFESGVFRLGWCRRCDHRWTERLSPRFVPRVRRPADRAPADGRAAMDERRAGGASGGA